ncbi:hypothetical protein EBT31_08570 [bacterium]|jgi:hypothetical protein|nr:hypothetical protein [bacterium]
MSVHLIVTPDVSIEMECTVLNKACDVSHGTGVIPVQGQTMKSLTFFQKLVTPNQFARLEDLETLAKVLKLGETVHLSADMYRKLDVIAMAFVRANRATIAISDLRALHPYQNDVPGTWCWTLLACAEHLRTDSSAFRRFLLRDEHVGLSQKALADLWLAMETEALPERRRVNVRVIYVKKAPGLFDILSASAIPVALRGLKLVVEEHCIKLLQTRPDDVPYSYCEGGLSIAGTRVDVTFDPSAGVEIPTLRPELLDGDEDVVFEGTLYYINS